MNDNKQLLAQIKQDLDFIELAIEEGLVESYQVVAECMSYNLQDIMGSDLYAHSANMDHLSGIIPLKI